MNNHPFNPVSYQSFQRPKFTFRCVRRVRFQRFYRITDIRSETDVMTADLCAAKVVPCEQPARSTGLNK